MTRSASNFHSATWKNPLAHVGQSVTIRMAGAETRQDESGSHPCKRIPGSATEVLSTGIASAVQDPPDMGLKVVVYEGESIDSALRRFKKMMERQRVTPTGRRSKGPFRWMLQTKEYYQKPSLFKRMKRVRRQKVTQQGTLPSPT